MFRRRTPTEAEGGVSITLDGSPIPAVVGEPIAAALLASDKTILARSPKLHRPRGPSCFRGGCDGCLMRVDGVPNVATCRVPVRGGERIESQNVIGARGVDLLRVTDWFFPNGMDHHHFMAGVPGIQDVMQTLARKVAGLGKLPDAPVPAERAERVACDVLVVGGGISGVTVASVLGEAGLDVLLVDDAPRLGGAMSPGDFAPLRKRRPLKSVRVRRGATAAAVYLGEVLVIEDEAVANRAKPSAARALVVRPRVLVLATGAHDATLGVPNADLPGVMSARALCKLLELGLEPEGVVGIVGDGFFADRLASRLAPEQLVRIAEIDLVAIRGTADVRRAIVREAPQGDAPPRERTVALGVLAVDLPGAPAFELASQAGAYQRFDHRRGYVVEANAAGLAADGVFVVGECAGADFEPAALEAAGERVAKAVREHLATGASFAAAALPRDLAPAKAPASRRPQSSMSAPKSDKPPTTKTKPKTASKPK